MKLYQIDYKKLVALLLPTMLRKPLILAILNSATVGVRSLHSAFASNRDDNMYRLRHTGQVCYLRAILNNAFESRSCDFTIEDGSVTSEWLYAMCELTYPNDQLYIYPEPSDIEVWSEDYILIETTPFMVGVPPELYADVDAMDKVRYLVNKYKLLSKRAVYSAI